MLLLSIPHCLHLSRFFHHFCMWKRIFRFFHDSYFSLFIYLLFFFWRSFLYFFFILELFLVNCMNMRQRFMFHGHTWISFRSYYYLKNIYLYKSKYTGLSRERERKIERDNCTLVLNSMHIISFFAIAMKRSVRLLYV